MERNRNEEPVMEMQIELFTLIHDVMKNIVFIILGGLAAAMLAYVAVNITYVPQYTTSTTFVVSSKESNNTYANLSAAHTMAITFQKLLESNVMKETIRKEMGVDEISASISAEVMEGTNLLVEVTLALIFDHGEFCFNHRTCNCAVNLHRSADRTVPASCGRNS